MRINVSKLLKSFGYYDRVKSLSSEFRISEDGIMYLYSKFMARSLTEYIKRAVKHQSIGGIPMRQLYKPLSKGYKKRKVKSNRDKFWVNTGWLIDQLHFWKYRDWFVGYPKYVKYRGRKVKAGDIFLYLENGTRNIPARPLMRYALRWFIRNFSNLTDAFILTMRMNKNRLTLGG